MKYKTILFDADGVLFDYRKAESFAFLKTFDFFKIKENLDFIHKKYKTINAKIWREFEEKKITSIDLRVERFSRLFKATHLKLDPVKVSKTYLKFLSECSFLIDGAEEIVEYFSEKCELAIITNGLADVQRSRIGNSRLASFFKRLFISEEIGYPKPHKEIFEFTLRNLKTKNKKDILLVGDNLVSDIKGGNDFGIDTCWFNQNIWNNKLDIHPTYEINNLLELKKIVGVRS